MTHEKKAMSVCPSCGSQKINRVRQKWTGQHNGHTYTVENLEFHECPDCGERIYDREAMRKIEANSPAFAKVATRK